MNFFNILSEFYNFKGTTDDPTLDFFNFLQSNYPVVWDNFNKFYADDTSQEGISPRMSLYEWDTLVAKGNFDKFLFSMHHNWEYFSDQTILCEDCKGEFNTPTKEHYLFNSYEGHISFSFYEHKSFDGALLVENYLCRECAIKHLKHSLDSVELDPEKTNFYA